MCAHWHLTTSCCELIFNKQECLTRCLDVWVTSSWTIISYLVTPVATARKGRRSWALIPSQSDYTSLLHCCLSNLGQTFYHFTKGWELSLALHKMMVPHLHIMSRGMRGAVMISKLHLKKGQCSWTWTVFDLVLHMQQSHSRGQIPGVPFRLKMKRRVWMGR